MNQYIKYINFAFCTILCFGMISCFDDEFYFGGDGNMMVTVTATADFTDEDSRAILNESAGKMIGAYTLLVFESNTNDATLLLAEDLGSDLTSTKKTVFMPRTDGFMDGSQSYYAVLFGNVTLSQLGLTVDASKLSDLYTAAYTVTSSDNNPTDASKFTWSAFLNVKKTDTTLKFNLNPNVAKVKLIVNNTSSNTNSGNESTQVVSAQVCNVKNKVRYAQNALSKAGLFTKDNNSAGSPSSINYKKDEINVAPNGGTGTLYWYVPCNMLASGVRNSNIPDGATYLELTSARGADHMSVVYKIYLGVNSNNAAYKDLTNFDVRPDHVYNVTVNITNDGLTFDVNNKYNAVSNANTSVGLVKLPSNANCYMINPNFSKTANGYPIYELPIDRINECWGANGLIPDTSMDLLDSEGWRMEVIWQDINARVIKFCDKNGNNASDTYSGTGVTPAYFKIYPSSVTSSHYGNILVGVKRKKTDGTYESTYLWSWHLWVTDYNPDAATPYSIAKNMTYVSSYNGIANALFHENSGVTQINGNVQHWWNVHDFYWGNTSEFRSKNVWGSGGIYENCWIMDRNLGAITSDARYGKTSSYGCYYQWGNKNPYPHAYHKYDDGELYNNVSNALKGLYKINGSDTTFYLIANKPTSLRTVKEVAQKPYACFNVGDDNYTDNEYNQLYKSYEGRNNYWASPKSNPTDGYTEKSIFDPCPPGWCVPMYDIIDCLTYNPSDTKFGTNSKSLYGSSVYHELHPAFGVYKLNSSGNSQNDYGSAYFLRKKVESTGVVSGNIYGLGAVFPIQGVLSRYDTGISGNSKAMMWFAESSKIPNAIGQGEAVGIWGTSTNGFSYKYMDANEQRTQTSIDIGSKKFNEGYSNEITYNHVWTGRVTHYPYKKSRGQNVRCIQVPGGEQLKYYNK